MDKGVRRAFDRARDTYREAARVQAEVAVECARLAGDGPLGRVLEIGAGCGLLTELLAPRTAGPYVALDLSTAMLGALPVPGVLRLAADGEAPPLRPGSFDFLASASAMQWFVRPEVALPACLDLLRPGGGFVLALFTEGTLAEPAWAARVSGFGSFWPLRPAGAYESMLAAMPGVRFQTEVREYTLHFPAAREAMRSLRRSGAGFGGGRPRPDKGRYRAFLSAYEERYGGERGLPLTYRAVFFRGVLGR